MLSNDEIIKRRHVEEAYETAIRRNREPVLPKGPGHTCKGSIFDCNRKTFEKALTDYWDRLFVGWNPYKKEGRGCWEVWQRPIAKTKLSSFEHWVADLDYLDINFIKKLRSMDAWAYKEKTGRQLWEDDDTKALEQQIALEKQEEDSIRYAAKHYKKAFGDLKDYTQSGFNPFWFFSDKKQQ